MSTSEVLSGLLWVEKYRPTQLEDVALEPDTRFALDSYIKAGEVPHLLMIGPPGSGKTTVARILAAALDCRLLTLNASMERGIDVVRTKVGSFATSMLGGRWNIVFLDEADAMTSDAQTSLRNLMEAHADRTRFVLTANFGWKIIAPIQSRCQLLTLGAPPLKERARVLTAVLKAEGVVADPLTVLGYAERNPDMRRMLMSAQKAVRSGTLLPAAEAAAATGADIYQLVLAKNWTALRGLTTSGDFDPAQALRELFYAVADDHPRAGFMRHVIGRAVHDSAYTPDPVVLFLAAAAELME